jgi:predicted nucleic acid-binding protein
MFRESPLSSVERIPFFEAFLSICAWTQVYYLWRPNLRDEGDNHLIELAVARGAALIVTNNIRDFRGSELRVTSIKIVEPEQLGKELK